MVLHWELIIFPIILFTVVTVILAVILLADYFSEKRGHKNLPSCRRSENQHLQ